MPLKSVLVERLSPREFEPGGRVHALTEEARGNLRLAVHPARHLVRRRAARGFLARGEGGRVVAAYLVEPDGTLFEMDASLATDTEELCESFRRVLVDGAVKSVLFRSDDSLLLPLALSQVWPDAAACAGHLLFPDRCGPFGPAKRADPANFVEIGNLPPSAEALRASAASARAKLVIARADATIAVGRIPFLESGPDESELRDELLRAGWRAAVELMRLPPAAARRAAPEA